MSGELRDWIEIFRAGDYTGSGKGVWTAEMLDQVAEDYDPNSRHAAPIVLGHPADDKPAFGWVARLRRAGESLWAQLAKVAPEFVELVRSGRFLQRSAAFYPRFPLTGRAYLKHVGFLGSRAPEVKGLAPIVPFSAFSGRALAVVEFSDAPAAMRPTQGVACARFTLSPGMRVCGLELADDAQLVSQVESVSYGEALRRARERWPGSY